MKKITASLFVCALLFSPLLTNKVVASTGVTTPDKDKIVVYAGAGEWSSIIKGTVNDITWTDNSLDKDLIDTQHYDITLAPYDSSCVVANCNKKIKLKSYAIIDDMPGYHYSWEVGNLMETEANGGNIPDGKYLVKVCRMGTDVCGVNQYPTTVNLTGPVAYLEGSPNILDVNQKGTWKINAYDQGGGVLRYSADWGDGVKQTSQKSPILTHSYPSRKRYNQSFTVTNNKGRSTKVVESSIFIGPFSAGGSIMILSPNGGEVLYKGSKQTITWIHDTSGDTSKSTKYYDIIINYCTQGSTESTSTTMRDMYGFTMGVSQTSEKEPGVCYGPFSIAKHVLGYSYDWQVGEMLNTATNETSMPGGSFFLDPDNNIIDEGGNYLYYIYVTENNDDKHIDVTNSYVPSDDSDTPISIIKDIKKCADTTENQCNLVNAVVLDNIVKDSKSFIFYRTLDVGTRGEDVKNLQNFLKKQGFFLTKITGIYDADTKEAVKKYQKKNEKDFPSGKVDSWTLQQIKLDIGIL